MNTAKRFLMIVTALLGALTIAGLQLTWNLQNTDYLESVTDRAQTSQKLTRALPTYAASKLPDPQAAKQVFAKNVTSADIDMALVSFHQSLTAAYVGKTDVVEVDLGPITRPVTANGYQIPPGTVFADDSLQIGGLAAILRLINRYIWPLLLVFIVFVALVIVLGIKQGFARSIRGISMLMALILGGFFLATLAVPSLVNTLVTSSGLDAALKTVIVDYIGVVSKDAGRYYAVWAIFLLLLAIILSLFTGHTRIPKKRHRQKNTEHKEKDSNKTQDW